MVSWLHIYRIVERNDRRLRDIWEERKWESLVEGKNENESKRKWWERFMRDLRRERDIQRDKKVGNWRSNYDRLWSINWPLRMMDDIKRVRLLLLNILVLVQSFISLTLCSIK